MMNDFIVKAQEVHGSKYIYDWVDYKNISTKVKIACVIHGIFEQKPSKHLLGQGCPWCSKYRKKSDKEFAEKAIKIHDGKYDYSKTDFSLIKNRVIIICPVHGEFLQVLDKHINFGRGCPDCGGSRKKTQTEFLIEAKNVHGELYDYSLSQYDNFEKKLIIICKRHGEFYQTPHNHIIGKQGCPHCVHRISKVETAWLDYIGLPKDEQHRNVLIKLDDRKIKADGYEPTTSTVYEFYGDYYHGNPQFFKSDARNPHTKCTFGELYQRTLEKEASILKGGLKLVSIWEHEWKTINET
jgi:hypothetical protein